MALMIALLLALTRREMVAGQMLEVPAVATVYLEDAKQSSQSVTYECSPGYSVNPVPIYLKGPGHPVGKYHSN